MEVTSQRLLTELGNRAWSGFNKDDMIFGNEEANTALAELNAAHRYLQALEDFPFKSKIEPLMAMSGMYEYSMVDGKIKEIINTDNLKILRLIEKPNSLKRDKNGSPSGYYITYDNPDANINLYPTPDRTYDYNIVYDSYKFILDNRGNELDEFTNEDDILNLPSYLAGLYMDCLVLRTMATNNKDIEDENYQPTLNEFNEAWSNFKRLAMPVEKEQRIII